MQIQKSQKTYFVVEYSEWDIYECSSYSDTVTYHVSTEEEAKAKFLEYSNHPWRHVILVKSLKKIEQVLVETTIDWPDSPENDV